MRTPTAILTALALLLAPLRAQTPPPFRVEEATIAEIHAAFRAGRLTCRGLVEQYQRRIAAYDKNGPAINALITLNPRVLAEADALDQRYKTSGPAGPLDMDEIIATARTERVRLDAATGAEE